MTTLTKRINKHFMKPGYVSILLLCVFVSACSSNNMTTIINDDGSCERILSTAVADKFIRGDTTDQPFPVDLHKWKISWTFKDNTVHTDWPVSNWQRTDND